MAAGAAPTLSLESMRITDNPFIEKLLSYNAKLYQSTQQSTLPARLRATLYLQTRGCDKWQDIGNILIWTASKHYLSSY